jgi:predicted nucleotidyltransferase component of viral defense system
MIKEWIGRYNPNSRAEYEQALKEIMQEITLAGLYRTDFFKVAAFYGGTALRILHGLDRFSEDLDFSLLKPSNDFDFEPYLLGIAREFDSFGIKVEVRQKIKAKASDIDSAFLKSNTFWNEILLTLSEKDEIFNSRPNIKIKIEVDTQPPMGFKTEDVLLLRPYSFYVKSYRLPDLFAGKLHALLFRKWKNRVKGRDWYDMEWYIQKGISVNLTHFKIRAIESGDWDSSLLLDHFKLLELLQQKIRNTDLELIKQDVRPFINSENSMRIWSESYFMDIIKLLQTE